MALHRRFIVSLKADERLEAVAPIASHFILTSPGAWAFSD
jgi:hypothetical protein